MSFGIGLGTWIALALGAAAGQQGEDRKPAQKPFDDAEFVKMAASDGLHEVALGKIAGEKAKNADVKKFAEKMVTDHTKANDDLKTAAKEAGVAVPEQMTDDHQKEVNRFKDYKGDNFDQDYVKHMVKDHEDAVALFTKATKEAKNKALREFATKYLPVIQGHLDDAKKLQK
jgi:putative membrane protein